MEQILAIDVDLTVVDTVTPWKKWYTSLTGHDLGEITSENNDLETLMRNHNDPLKFWRRPDLYDDLVPLEDAKKYIPLLKELGLTIIFVSTCMPEHEDSKRFFLQRHFPFMDGFVSTGDKKFVQCDYFVDDYKKNCKQLMDKASVYQIKSELNSPSEDYPYVTWEEIYNDIVKRYKLREG